MNYSDNLNIKLAEMKGNLSQKQKWEIQLADYRKDFTNIKASIAAFEKQLSAEMKDVKKLEGISFSGLFQTFFGSKEEKLTKEKQEVIAVQLQLNKAEKTKTELIQSIEQLKQKIENTGNIEKEYVQLMMRKEELIKNRNSASSEQLFELTEQADEVRITLKELNEAITAGNIAKRKLRNAVSSLKSASGWGTFDLLGGGAIASMVKYSHIDEATDRIHEAQSGMRHFQKELLDVDESADLEIEISGLLKFADFFFDDIISDWMVQGKIRDSLAQVSHQLANVESIIDKLNLEAVNMKGELRNIEIAKKELIEIS